MDRLSRLSHANVILIFVICFCLSCKGKLDKEELSLRKSKLSETYRYKSKIDKISLSSQNIKYLTDLGIIWGFLKYYHSAIAEGSYNWDAELFLIIPKIIQAKTQDEENEILESWIDKLGPTSRCDDCADIVKELKLAPDYDYLLNKGNFSQSIVKKLTEIKNSRHQNSKDYFFSITSVGNPDFTNENSFDNSSFPDPGLRLLALYRYWNIIQYFYPYRYLIKTDWNKILATYIPRFLNAKDSRDYVLVCLEIIGMICDTHANVYQNNILDSIKGKFVAPFQTQFIEGKLVITDYYDNKPQIEKIVKIGDVIDKIDGISVDSLTNHYLPWTPASNPERQLFDLSSMNGFLLRSYRPDINILIKRNGVSKNIILNRILFEDAMKYRKQTNRYKKAYELLTNNIGYIYTGSLQSGDLKNIETLFQDTKGVIIDLRCYPSTFMPIPYGSWLKDKESEFAQYRILDQGLPGAFKSGIKLKNGGKIPNSNALEVVHHNLYKGKVIILVNSSTWSQAEYTAMSLGSVPNSITIGSVSAGADGDVSKIVLPGNIVSLISGIGVYYPDGRETQQVGVKIDIQVKPTIKGISEGKDELIEKGIQTIDSLTKYK